MDSVSAIAASIRAARKKTGLTQADLAELAEVLERTVRAMETATGNPSPRAVISVLGVLGLRLTVAR
ncbi:helix-turn-helix domain-containing protein [Paeniglutamicibacter kerguelensis]|uniref:DNA-binding XRE family transcriptional regulator n=1 Tax=Paeniglutamicibacter kerguelensis TaxID=254788 RepID=A0ABS4XCD8_9MICC|nr:helix-turn-helix domain-containing protein [Paeniglutamicibacter kerguelensis]MBP2386143.1 DNA-binding XRE family transcriptional regulator [Paeniglutamicibacter kerguelensis]